MTATTGLSSKLQLLDKRTFINLFIKHIFNLSFTLFYNRLLLKASITLIIAILVLSSSYSFLEVASALLSSANNNNNKQRHVIQICCAWGDKLADGILTYKIKGGSSVSQQAINKAIEEWNSKITNIKLESTDDNISADIDIKISSKTSQVTHDVGSIGGGHAIAARKNTKLVQPGEAVISFDISGLITHVDMTISTRALGSSFNTSKLESIAKHEIGHALGIGHTDFVGDLMSPVITGRTDTSISQCDINGIAEANQWKLKVEDLKVNTRPHAPSLQLLEC
jgi:Matrixin